MEHEDEDPFAGWMDMKPFLHDGDSSPEEMEGDMKRSEEHIAMRSYTYVDCTYSCHADDMDTAIRIAQGDAMEAFKDFGLNGEEDIEIKRVDHEPDVAGLHLYTVEMLIRLPYPDEDDDEKEEGDDA